LCFGLISGKKNGKNIYGKPSVNQMILPQRNLKNSIHTYEKSCKRKSNQTGKKKTILVEKKPPHLSVTGQNRKRQNPHTW